MIELTPDFDPISGKLAAQVEADLAGGNYLATISVADVAGNLSQQQVNFKLDLTATDSQPPIIRPQFPLPDQEISTVSMMAIKFQVLDADSEVNFEEMVVEINGVIYENLFKAGNANRYNRDTGEVILFGRLQLDIAGLEDPLDIAGLENPLELGVLDKPLDLSFGANLIGISIGDMSDNLNTFEFSFGVSLTPAAIPTYDISPPKPPILSDLRLSNIYQQEAKVTAGQSFTFNFDARENVVAAFMDLSPVDDSTMGAADGETGASWEIELADPSADPDTDLELLQPSLDLDLLQALFDQLVEEGEAGLTVNPSNLRRFALFRSITIPYDVRYGSNRYQISGQVNSETKIKGGEKTLPLVVISQDLSAAMPLLELDFEEIRIEFSNPATDQQRRSSKRRSRRSRQNNRLQVVTAYDANPESDITGYKVHHDTDAAGYPYANSTDVGNVTSYTIPSLTTGTTYYTAVSAYDSDGNESWVSANVTVTTLGPRSVASSETIRQSTQKTIYLTGVHSQSLPLTFTITSQPSQGTLGTITPVMNTAATVTYTPSGVYTGSDSFAFTTNDGTYTSSPATVSITVVPLGAPNTPSTPDLVSSSDSGSISPLIRSRPMV